MDHKSGPDKFTLEAKEKFLRVYAETGNIRYASKAAGVCYDTIFRYKRENQVFFDECKEAREEFVENMLQEAHRRATHGVKKPVFWQGWETGYVQEYSDSLLMFLIKGNRPEYATERRELTGKDGERLDLGTRTLTDDQLRAECVRLAARTGIALSAFEGTGKVPEDPQD